MIKVQFPWQKKKGLMTPWLRVVTPYAGKGKGMHIIPEVGEEVIIGFDNGNAERPFVFGAMFNGKASAGTGGAGNFMKGLQTVAGQRLHMNDKDGSLHMQDNGGVSMKFDGGGNAHTKVNCKHNIDVGNTHTTDVGKGASKLTMSNGGVIELSGNSSITLKVGSSSIVIDGTSITVKAETVNIEGTSTTSVGKAGGNPGMVVTSNVVIKGGEVDIN